MYTIEYYETIIKLSYIKMFTYNCHFFIKFIIKYVIKIMKDEEKNIGIVIVKDTPRVNILQLLI